MLAAPERVPTVKEAGLALERYAQGEFDSRKASRSQEFKACFMGVGRGAAVP